MDKFGMVGKVTAKPGKRDELVSILMEIDPSQPFDGCQLYAVSIADNEPDAVYVMEIWKDAESHAASLKLAHVQNQIQRAMPLIAGMEGSKLRTLGGIGV